MSRYPSVRGSPYEGSTRLSRLPDTPVCLRSLPPWFRTTRALLASSTAARSYSPGANEASEIYILLKNDRTHPAIGNAVKYRLSPLRLSLIIAEAPILFNAPHEARLPMALFSSSQDQASAGIGEGSDSEEREGIYDHRWVGLACCLAFFRKSA